jgi:VanZ family protein
MQQQPPSQSPFAGLPWPLVRWVPFAAAALFSLALAAVAPDGRKPFYIDWSLSREALEFSIVKLPHIGAAAFLAVLGVFGAGRPRWLLALALTILVGWGWELSQTTVAGHHARLSDLLPDTLGALLGCMVGSRVLRLIELRPIRVLGRR